MATRTTPRALVPNWLWALLAVSVVGFIAAGLMGDKLVSAAAAATGGLALVAAGFARAAQPHPNDAATTATAAQRQHSDFARLIALAFAWGGVALLATYLGTPLRWQHGWQYGSAMLLLAAVNGHHGHRVLQTGALQAAPTALRRVALLAALQAVAIALGLAWMLAIGKLSSPKGDWVANHVFLAGGGAIAVLSLLLARAGLAASNDRAADQDHGARP